MKPYTGKKDKTRFYYVMTFLMGALFSAFGIWTIVEFILYLVKDDPFIWISLWLTVITFVLELYYFIRIVFN